MAIRRIKPTTSLCSDRKSVLQYTQVWETPQGSEFSIRTVPHAPAALEYNKILHLSRPIQLLSRWTNDATRDAQTRTNYHTIERIYAAYAMNTITFGRAG